MIRSVGVLATSDVTTPPVRAPALHLGGRRLLWSGGFDSTARLCQLLAAGERVELVTLREGDEDESWQKPLRERAAREQIVRALPAAWRTHLRYPPLLEPTLDHLAVVDRLWRVYWHEGPEDWRTQDPSIAAAGLLFPGIEACYVAGDSLTANPARVEWLRAHGVALPQLTVSKPTLWADAQQGGWAAVLRLTWSCEADNLDALNGPCGQCVCCRLRILPAVARVSAPLRVGG